ncbi:MAG TPA: helix-turn-helix transcriptional regulator [Ramlibacter sp.]|jgi:DNA-binding CsgD family transcriptional regulator
MEQLVSDIYAAASGRAEWSVVLGKIAASLDLWTVQVLGMDKRNGHLMFSVHGGRATPETALDYFREYSAIDPRVGLASRTPVGEWFHCHEHFDDSFVRGNRFYQDFLIPHGGRYATATVLRDDESVTFVLAVMRGPQPGAITTGEMPRLEILRHHFAEALSNLAHMREAYAELGMAKELLSQFDWPMLLVDDTRGLWHHNARAAAYLEDGRFVTVRAGLLASPEGEDDNALTEAVYCVLQVTEANLPVQRRTVVLRHKGARLFAFVSALPPRQVLGAFGYGRRALIVLHDPEQRRAEIDPFLLSECFGLTPAEARVAARLATGSSVRDISTRSELSVATVRTHVQRIMQKTGVQRQADLVRVLIGLPK